MPQHPAVQVGVGKLAAVGVFLGELQRDAAGTRFHVRAEGETDVGRETELDFVGQGEIGLRLGAAKVARAEGFAGDRTDEGSVLKVALAVGEVHHAPAAHERSGDALARFLRLALQGRVLDAASLIDDLGHTGEVVLAGAGAVAGKVPEREAAIPAHESAAVGCDHARNRMHEALLVAELEAEMSAPDPIDRLVTGHAL